MRLRSSSEVGNRNVEALALGRVVELLYDAGRPRTAALICGWLDRRSGRSVDTVGTHDAAVAAVRRSVVDQWDRLVKQGRSMARSHVFEIA